MALRMYRWEDRLYIAYEGQPGTWTEMQARAQALGGGWNLASLNDAAEDGFVQAILGGTSWIGLVQAPGAETPDSGWSWLDGTAASYVNWAPNEPNDYYGPGSEEHGLIYGGGGWNDEHETETLPRAVFEASAREAHDLTGSQEADRLRGGKQGDRLAGGAGEDRLIGGAGGDTLAGGAGTDVLVGGAGEDVFVFEAEADSVDVVRDFVSGIDRLDLSALSPDLHWGGMAGFHGQAGEVTAEGNATTGRTRVMVDLDGDGQADAALRLVGALDLTEADFLGLA